MGDLYDEEFNQYLQHSKVLMSQLSRTKDKVICSKWINKLCNLNSDDPTVKKNRNGFFKYLIQILNEGVIETRRNADRMPFIDDMYNEPVLEKTAGFMSRWSSDKRTYIAAKALPGRGALIYMAVSNDPTLGWDQPNNKH